MRFGSELKKSIQKERERYIDALNRRDERIKNWETDEDDCFMSIACEQKGIHKCDLQLGILDTDGTEEFDAVFDEDGKEVYTKWVNTRYGFKIVGRGVFANSKKALLRKTGWTERRIRVPVWTKFSSGGSGMYGVYAGDYTITRWHTNMVTGEYFGFPE